MNSECKFWVAALLKGLYRTDDIIVSGSSMVIPCHRQMPLLSGKLNSATLQTTRNVSLISLLPLESQNGFSVPAL